VAWSAQVGQKLSQPVLAGGLVFVADVDAHRVVCLDAATGEQQWSFTADGRVDSPPTIHEGLAIFGSADGHLYALGARDGVFRWRRRLAPGRAQVVSFGQLESVWPVHGSVLVKDGLVYATAGRSSYLDGGIRVFALEPRTGEIVHETTLEGPVPELPEVRGRPFDMDGTNSDILVTDGEYIYMQQIVLNNELERQSTERLSHMGDRKVGRHLFATGGFLNASLFNRIYWGYWSRWPGFYLANQAPKSGQILVHDDERTYAVRYFAERYRLGSRYIPGGPGCLVTADDNDNEPLLYDGKSEPRPIKWLPFETKGKRGNYASKAENVNKGTGFTRSQKPVWMEWVAVRVHGLVLAGDRLVLAGAPDELDPEDPMAGFEGRNGCVLQVLDTTTGKVVEQGELDSPPVWDGMCAAQGRLYVSTMDGRVLCLGAAAE
jgi:outer membrane protein assembly factor BamB